MIKPTIVVRTYLRSAAILRKTLLQLSYQKDLDLANQLILVVADHDEYEKYKMVLRDYPLKDILISGVGGHVATNCAIDHLPEGEPVVFIDDDLEDITLYSNIAKKVSHPLTQMGGFHNYIFKRMTDSPIFSVDFANTWFDQHKQPFFTFRPRTTCGTWWGGFNSDLFKTNQSHDDDNIRTARVLDKYSGIYVINWINAITRWGLTEGGMQASGDRGEDRLATTHQRCLDALKIPEVSRFFREATYVCNGMHSLSLKTPEDLKVILGDKFKVINWSGYYQDQPDVPQR
jgi:hypothetical protein